MPRIWTVIAPSSASWRGRVVRVSQLFEHVVEPTGGVRNVVEGGLVDVILVFFAPLAVAEAGGGGPQTVGEEQGERPVEPRREPVIACQPFGQRFAAYREHVAITFGD